MTSGRGKFWIFMTRKTRACEQPRAVDQSRAARWHRPFVILPVDQGFEHGPARSFAANPPGYNPRYHFSARLRRRLQWVCGAAGFH